MSKYFPKSFRGFGRNINLKVDLSNYATKTKIKNTLHVYTSSFALKTNSSSLETGSHKLDLSKLSDTVKNDVVKKTVYDKLVAKVKNIDTCDFVLKTK